MKEHLIVVAIWHEESSTMTEHKLVVQSDYDYPDDGFSEDMYTAADKLGLDSDNIEDWYPPSYAEDPSLR